MLRQVTLQVRAENKLQDAAKANGVSLRVMDCKPFNRSEMSLFMELKGPASSSRGAVAAIGKVEGVREVIEGEPSGETVPLLLVLEGPALCRASNDAAIVCLECPLNYDGQPASWRFIVRRTGDFRKIMTGLAHEGIKADIQSVAPLEAKADLTGRQKEIVAVAVARGYFEFPRKISLTELSGVVGVGLRPSARS